MVIPLIILYIVVHSFAFAEGALPDFGQCLADIQRGVYGAIVGLDAYGLPVENISDAKGVNYTTCLHVCGSGTEASHWPTFSQQFSAWFIPWLALLSQLPFGAEDRLDNVVSLLMFIGSPALGAYSLTMTLLNRRWLKKRMAQVRYPNTGHFVAVFSTLQHIPITLITEGPLLPSLVVLPENDVWWAEMAERTEQTRNWNIPAAANIAWVLVAFLFTIIDSFHDFGRSGLDSHGHAVAAVWMWLIPLVAGWLQVGSQTESNQLRRALRHSNAMAYVATSENPIHVGRISDRRAIDYDTFEGCHIRRDEERATPVFNYARVLFWSQIATHVLDLYQEVSLMAAEHITVSKREWVPSSHGQDAVHDDNRTGKADQVMRYCRRFYPVSNNKSLLGLVPSPIGPRWASGIIKRMLLSTLLALFLQWSTSGAAIILTILTPTIGLSCRSMAYMVYGCAATFSMCSLVLSSLLVHASRPSWPEDVSHRSRSVAALGSTFRWMGKTIAIINALGIITACTFQFTNVYTNCFCMSSVIGLGTRGVWIGSIALSLSSALLYGLFVCIASSHVSL